MTTSTKDESLFDGFELHDVVIDRVDVVGKGANGKRGFILMKSAADGTNLLASDDVRELIKQAEGDDMPSTAEVVEEPVVKADELDVTVPLADAEAGAPTIGESQPGSAAWEAIDAATGEKWVGILARAKNAIELLAGREMQESVSESGDDDDMVNSWDLEDACAAIDYAIGLVAGYAAREGAEVSIDDDMSAVGKALYAIDIPSFAESLTTIEQFGTLAKSGRVLSGTNQGLIESAAEALQKVLSSLPSAPEVADSGEVAKADPDVPVEPAAEPEAAPVEKAEPEPAPAAEEPVAKADGDLVPVYDANGKLVGVVKPGQIQALATTPDPADNTDTGAEADPTTADPVPAPAVPAVATPVAPVAPVTKTEAETVTLTKSDIDTLVASAIEKARAEQDEQIAELTKTVKWLSEPAKSKVALNGAASLPLRGQDDVTAAGSGSTSVTKSADDLRKQLEQAVTPTDRETASRAMQALAMTALSKAQGNGTR
jgi:hypothetical protein